MHSVSEATCAAAQSQFQVPEGDRLCTFHSRRAEHLSKPGVYWCETLCSLHTASTVRPLALHVRGTMRSLAPRWTWGALLGPTSSLGLGAPFLAPRRLWTGLVGSTARHTFQEFTAAWNWSATLVQASLASALRSAGRSRHSSPLTALRGNTGVH